MAKTKNKKNDININYLQALFENISDLIFVCDANGIIKYVTPSIKSVLGFNPNEVLNSNILQLVHSDELEAVKQKYSQLISNPKIPIELTLKTLHKDGSIIYITGAGKNLLANKEIEGIVITTQDVTKKTISESKMQRKKRLLDSTEKIANIGGWEFDVLTQKFYWTDETYLMHGIEPDDSDDNLEKLVAKSISCYSPKDQIRIIEVFNECVKNGVPYKIECKFMPMAADNSIWIVTSGEPVYENGEIVKVFGHIANITEKKNTERLTKVRLELVQFSYNSTLDEFLQKFLDEIEKHTESKIGFYHFVNDDQESITLQIWSTNTLKSMCNAEGKGAHYGINEAGVWTDCFYTRKPVIHNDYNSLPNKKGMPEGHATVTRELTIPLIRNDKVVAILGVGNKEENYDSNDIEFITNISDLAWDITQRKRTEEALHKSESRFKLLSDSLPIAIFETDAVGNCVYVNKMWCKLTGLEPFEAMGNGWTKSIYSEDKNRISNLWHENTKQNTPWNYEFRVCTPNGKISWVLSVAIPFNDGQNNTTYIGSNIDITSQKELEQILIKSREFEQDKSQELEKKNKDLQRARTSMLNVVEDLATENEERRKAEQLLKAGELKFRTMSDYTFDMEYWEDENNQIVYIAPSCQRVTGYTREEILANSSLLLEIVHPDDKEMMEKHHNEGFLREHDEHVFSLEFRIINKNNTLVYLEHICRPIFDDSNKFMGRRVSNRDISERIIAGKALKESEMRYRILADNSPMPVIAVSLVDGNLLFANKSAYKLMRVRQDVKSINEFFAKDFYVEPQKRLEFLEKLKNNGSVSGFEVNVKTMDGLIITVLISAIITTFENETAIFSSFYDISDRIKAEASLRESELRFQNVVEATGDWIWEIDNNGLYTYCSEVCIDLLGYSPDEIIGKKYFYDIFENEKKEELKNLAFSLMAKKETFSNFDNLILHKNGSVVYITSSAMPIFDNNGNLIGYRGADKNISSRKKAEMALRESEGKFRNIFENHSAIKLLIDPENGNIVDANKSASEFYGWSIDELKAMKVFQLNILSTEATKQEMNKVINKTKGVFQFKHRLANGDIRDIESYSCLIKIGEENFLYSIIHDVTERRKAEIELQKRSLAIEQSSASIVITDFDGNIEYVNPKFTEVTGYSFQEIFGQNPRVLKSGEQPNEFYRELWDTILLGENWSGVFHNQKKNGELFWESAIISPVKNDDGKITNFVAIKEDITEKVERDLELKKYRESLEDLVTLRTEELNVLNKELVSQLEKGKQLEIQLAESLSKEKEINELKTKFIATVSHEFRTPLAALLSSTQIIQRYAKSWSEEKLKAQHERIESTTAYLTQLLDEVLTISRADGEILTNNPEPLNINNFVEAIFDQLQHTLTQKHNLVFNNKIDFEIIRIDKKLLNHILLNLLTNAIKYSPNGGNVELNISTENDNLIISVADNGLGIPEDEIKYIFDAFYRTKNSAGINGTGLGLNIIKRSLDVIGGTVSVDSKVGEGSKFIVRIPNYE